MTPTVPTLTTCDLIAMVVEATRRGCNASQPAIDGLVTPNGGNMQAAEDVLAVAALAEVLRYRVEQTARSTPGMAAALVKLHQRVGLVLATAERIGALKGAERG